MLDLAEKSCQGQTLALTRVGSILTRKYETWPKSCHGQTL